MNRDIIGVVQCFLELHVFDPGLLVLNAARVAQVHQILNGGDELLVLIRRVVAKHIHVEPRTFLNHRQADAAGADDGDGFARNFIAEERQERMPRRPFLFAHEAVASVSTSAVFVNGILYLFASARLTLSKPTAICATTLSVPFPASKTSASIGSRSVVINPSMPLFTLSMINFFGGASGPSKTSRSYPRSLRRSSAASPMRAVANTRKRFFSDIVSEQSNQEIRNAEIFLL